MNYFYLPLQLYEKKYCVFWKSNTLFEDSHIDPKDYIFEDKLEVGQVYEIKNNLTSDYGFLLDIENLSSKKIKVGCEKFIKNRLYRRVRADKITIVEINL